MGVNPFHIFGIVGIFYIYNHLTCPEEWKFDPRVVSAFTDGTKYLQKSVTDVSIQSFTSIADLD